MAVPTFGRISFGSEKNCTRHFRILNCLVKFLDPEISPLGTAEDPTISQRSKSTLD